MMKIGLLSDTHGYLSQSMLTFFSDCDEIWHAGDFGHAGIAEQLSEFRPLKGVYGNIDGSDIRIEFPEKLRFKCEETDVLICHIGGYPGNYDRKIRQELMDNPPDLFICGHSHILKVMYDKKLGFLHINPGAAGKYGFHHVLTSVRFEVDEKKISKLEILEIQRK
ncbi:MAG: metallophosphoesterase family protein [Bacteroidia bacterium]|nr:metallophosphoesterase family protein [Bacteroidia bacterium]